MNPEDNPYVNYLPNIGTIDTQDAYSGGFEVGGTPSTNTSPPPNEQANEAIINRGLIAGWNIVDGEIYSGSLRLNNKGFIASGKTVFDNTETGFILGIDRTSSDTPKFYIGSTTAYLNWTGTNLQIQGATVAGLAAGSEAAIQQWTYTGAFSAASVNQVNWTGGTLTLADGTEYTITGSNTGAMAAFNYIYLDIGTSTTAFQVNTSFTAGSGKILICTAQNGTGDATEASFLMMGGAGTHNIDGSSIAAKSVLAGNIAVTNLSTIKADMGTITAGTITMDTSGYVRGGATDYLTGTGFFLGYSGAAYKFSVGNPSGEYIGWDGSNLTITAALTVDLSLSTDEEAVAIRDALSFSPNVTDLDNIVTTVGDANVGDNSTHQFQADSFVASHDYTHLQVTLRVKKVGSPTSTTINIYADSGGDPSGASLGSASISGLSTSYQDLTFLITLSGALTATNTYWMAVFCDESAGNYLKVAQDGSGSHKVKNAGTWEADNSGDLIYKVRGLGGTATASTVYPATALIADSANKFIGFAVAAASASSTVKVRTDGTMGGFTITETEAYFLSDTHGAISTTAGSNSRLIGRAVSGTQLQIKYATVAT